MRTTTWAFVAALPSACAGEPEIEATGAPHGHHGHAMHHRFDDADAWTKVFDDPTRDAWQRPDDVLRQLALTPAMRVADIGAGTGYFAVRLARAVPAGEVIATDTEADMVRHLTDRARREQLPNLRAVLATATDSGLAAGSVDRILIVHVWHHLADRPRFARELAAVLRPSGKLVVVDFGRDATRGPPIEHRLTPEAIVADFAAAGLTARVVEATLPDQYMIEAWSDQPPQEPR